VGTLKTKRAALYLRCSGQRQQTDTQQAELEELCKRRRWAWTIYRDHGQSGAKETRPALQNLLQDARHRKFDVVLVWAIDRLARNTRHFLEILDTLQRWGVQFSSYTQPMLDTDSPQGKCLVQLLAIFAELERDLLRQRVTAGLRMARKRGAKLGRPPLRRFTTEEKREIRLAHIKGRKSIRRLAIENGTTQYIIAGIVK
jgi:DNA invertase Pin-like site-specific DNA recombinase